MNFPTNQEKSYENQNKLVQDVIKNNYKNSTQQLCLLNQNNWDLVLKHRDWTCIKQLGLTNCKIEQKIYIVIQKPWPNLILLALSDNKIRSRGIKLLVRSDFPKLQDLWLFSCDIGNEGLKHLTKSNWPKMKMLHLSDNFIGIDGYFSCYQNNWQQIQQIRMTQNQNDPIILFGFAGQPSKHLEKLLVTIKNNQIDSDLRPVFESILKK